MYIFQFSLLNFVVVLNNNRGQHYCIDSTHFTSSLILSQFRNNKTFHSHEVCQNVGKILVIILRTIKKIYLSAIFQQSKIELS